jgi:putative glycosyltransferase
MKLSIVTTLYNSGKTVESFYRQAADAASAVTSDWELVMVDDGSPDDSLARACAIAESDPRLRVVELSRNFGHHKALMAGLDHAEGELVFLIDSDLEEDPALLVQFHRQLEEADWDVVYGYQAARKGGFFESWGGQIVWHLIHKLYSVRIPMNQCTVRLMRRDYVNSLLKHRESNTVIGGLWVITGYRQLGLPIHKGSRKETSYRFLHRVGTLANGITSFSTAPLLLMVYVGIFLSFVSFALGLIVIVQKLLYNAAVGWASLIVSIWFVGGIILLSLGVIGIYISRIFLETKNRPYVIVRKVYQKDAQS